MASGLTLNVSIPGLDQLRSRMGAGAKTLDTELRPALRASGTDMKNDARSRAKGNILPNSVQLESRDGGLTMVVGSAAKTGLSIEQGRRPGERPAVGLVTAWMNRYGIVSERASAAGAVQNIKTHKVLTGGKRRAGIRASQRDMAWKIAMAIEKFGTKPLPFIAPVAAANQAQISRRINDAIQRALRRVAKG